MGTWIKETDAAIYLMDGGHWIDRIDKSPSSNNPQEQVLDVVAMAAWMMRTDAPTAMVFSLGTGYAEPPPASTAPPPTASCQIYDDVLLIIVSFDGLELTAYQDSVGIWTIGYGHTSMAGPPTVTPGLRISEAEAERILQQDLKVFERGVDAALAIATTADQFSAMVSFAFNVGVGALEDSTLLRKHNAGDFVGAADEFLRWVFAGGQKLAGLERRRNAERALYLSQDYMIYL